MRMGFVCGYDSKAKIGNAPARLIGNIRQVHVECSVCIRRADATLAVSVNCAKTFCCDLHVIFVTVRMKGHVKAGIFAVMAFDIHCCWHTRKRGDDTKKL